MSEEEERKSSWFRSLCCRIVRTGHIPRHVAIIMDGNRRFAKKMKYSEVFHGHVSGFNKFMETLEWCLDLGILEVTVYVFSIENFKRSKEEVDGLMELAKQRLAELLVKRDLIMKHSVCIRFLGDLEMLPKDVLESVARVVNITRNNNGAFLNVCFSYTSRNEMTEAIRRLAQGTMDEMILPSDISEELFEKCLYTGNSPPPDLVIRTSGEVRLSDFLLWQSSYSCLCFQDVLWPEFSIWNFFSAIIMYQRNYSILQIAREKHDENRMNIQYECDKKCVSRALADSMISCDLDDLDAKISKYAFERQKRVEKFVQYVRNKRRLYLEQACPHF